MAQTLHPMQSATGAAPICRISVSTPSSFKILAASERAVKVQPCSLLLPLKSETFEKNGRTFFSYFIKGNIRGKEVKVAVVPPDKGGYTVLDIVFGDAMAAELVLKPYEIKDESTGRVISGNTYAVQTVDEDGEIYECSIKPYRNSDKALLNMLVKQVS